jgi:hypothetical protein
LEDLGLEWMARDAEEREGIAKEGSPAAKVNRRCRFSKGAELVRPAARSPGGDGAPAVAR